MARKARTTTAIMIGLMLGYCAAGWWDVTPMFAAGTPHADSTPDRQANDAHSEDSNHDGHAGGQSSAGTLVPHDQERHAAAPHWFGCLIGIGIGLFVVALILGAPLRVFGIKDPGAEATEQDNAESHHH